jgi:hypothetical protein
LAGRLRVLRRRIPGDMVFARQGRAVPVPPLEGERMLLERGVGYDVLEGEKVPGGRTLGARMTARSHLRTRKL